MRKFILGTLIAIVVVGAAAMIERSIRLNRPIPSEMAPTGKVLPKDTKLLDVSTKKTVTTEKYLGKVVLVNFWASWCTACMVEMPSIVKLHEMLKVDGFEILSINVDEDPQAVVPEIVRKYKMNFPVYSEIDSELSKKFNVVAIPYSAMLDKKMQVVWAESGERDWTSDEVITEIKRLQKAN